ncbi:MAG: hypothetical protein ACTHN5_01895 [Phycisphaerae bacterium]
MTDVPPPLPQGEVDYQNALLVNRDDEHLRMLSIFWYVWSGLSALFGTFPVIHLVIGLVILLSPGSFGGGRGGPPPPEFMGWMFTCIGGGFVLLGWTGAVLGFLTGRSLTRRRRLVLCQIAAGVACINIPLGTVLGVFTFIVLGRPSVRSTFV